MKHSEKFAPVAAALTAVTTLVCCLPLGFAAAAATAGLSTVVASYQSWFIGASIVLLLVGVFQLRRAQRTCGTGRWSSVLVLAVSGAIVLLVVVLPQTLAGILADWLP